MEKHIKDFAVKVVAECKKFGLPETSQHAYVLATVQHETANTYKPVKEAYWLSENWRRQNLRYYPFYGRGFVQITWKSNYQKYSKLLGVDMVKNPDLALNEDYALFILVHGFKNGTFTGKKLEDYVKGNSRDYYNARRCINILDKASEIAELAKTWETKLAHLDTSIPVKKPMNSKTIEAKQDTVLKKQPVQSSDLTANQKSEVLTGKKYKYVSIEQDGNHSKVELDYGAGTWYIYNPHWIISEVKSEPEQGSIDWNNMDAKVSKYFTVREVTNGERRRIPTNPQTIERIVKLCYELDKVREAWGSPLLVNSFHRPLAVNRAIGSGDRSRHVQGDAADVRPANGKLWEFQSWIDKRWYGALGYGAKKGFVHLDMRNGKGFESGGSKSVRWNY